MPAMTATLISFNEALDLPRALASLAGIADEIILVDSGSSDQTCEIARTFGARVYARKLDSFDEQKNYASSLASNDWIFSIDCDQELSPELRSSMLAWKQQAPSKNAYEIPLLSNYLGGWIRHSGWYPNMQRRLYRKSAAHYEGIVHETLVFDGKFGRLQGDLLHYTMETFAEHEAKVESYCTLGAQKMFDAGKRSWRVAMWFATPWTFLQTFVLRAGFLDGYRGALIAQMAARSVRLKFQRLGALIQQTKRYSN